MLKVLKIFQLLLIFALLTAKVKTLTKNAQAAKYHWDLQTESGASSSSLLIASKLTIDMGMTIMVTTKSVNPIFTIRLFPAWCVRVMHGKFYDNERKKKKMMSRKRRRRRTWSVIRCD